MLESDFKKWILFNILVDYYVSLKKSLYTSCTDDEACASCPIQSTANSREHPHHSAMKGKETLHSWKSSLYTKGKRRLEHVTFSFRVLRYGLGLACVPLTEAMTFNFRMINSPSER